MTDETGEPWGLWQGSPGVPGGARGGSGSQSSRAASTVTAWAKQTELEDQDGIYHRNLILLQITIDLKGHVFHATKYIVMVAGIFRKSI